MANPIRDQAALNALAKILGKRCLSIPQIQDRFSVSERTAYRWLTYLSGDGYDIISRREEGVVFYERL